jgi:hypothetical protein
LSLCFSATDVNFSRAREQMPTRGNRWRVAPPAASVPGTPSEPS